MKKLIFLLTGIVCLSSMSFVDVNQGKVEMTKNGNYLVTNGVLSGDDAKVLHDLTVVDAGETTVVHKTVIKHQNYRMAGETTVVNETIWKHKDDSVLLKNAASKSRHEIVKKIMATYL
jgi:hypothetical protein